MVKGVEQLMAESELTSSHPSFKQWPLPRLLLTLFLLLLRVNSGAYVPGTGQEFFVLGTFKSLILHMQKKAREGGVSKRGRR